MLCAESVVPLLNLRKRIARFLKNRKTCGELASKAFTCQQHPSVYVIHAYTINNSHAYASRFLLPMDQAGAQSASSLGRILEPLMAREIEILRLIVTAMRNQDIADRLFISLHTVKSRLGGTNVYAKLGSTSITERLLAASTAPTIRHNFAHILKHAP